MRKAKRETEHMGCLIIDKEDKKKKQKQDVMSFIVCL